jgi:pilus assembly protein CpaB
MRGGRLLLIIGGILIIGALTVGIIFWLQGQRTPEEPEVIGGEETPAPQVSTVDIVVAAQHLPAGTEITEAMTRGEAPAVTLKPWPENVLPSGYISRIEDVIGRRTRVEMAREQPIQASMLMEPTAANASLQIPEGRVAYALPVARYSSVAWALQPGDHVDMIISLLLVDLDEEFQTIAPNQGSCLSPSDDLACAGMGGPVGRLEVMPNGWLVNLTPGETQRARLVTQLTVQNALVLRVGDWPTTVKVAETEATPTADEATVPPDTEPVEPILPTYAPLTLAVGRQDAMVLDYAQLTGAHITFVLRRLGDEGQVSTDSVTLQYLMDRFNIEMPVKLPYGVDPRVQALEGINIQEATTYQPESQPAQ